MISSSLETLVTKRQFMESNQLWFGQKCTRTQSEYLVLETPFYFTVNGILLPGKVETFFPAFLFSVDPIQPQSFDIWVEDGIQLELCRLFGFWHLKAISDFMNYLIFKCMCGLGILFECYQNLNFVLFHFQLKSFDL